jgi:2-keto-4-pentenoate hydratase
MQRALGIDRPDYGHLFDDMFFSEFAEIDPARFLQPRIEPEIGFVIGRSLGGGTVTTVDVARATDHVVPVLEIIDSRHPPVDLLELHRVRVVESQVRVPGREPREGLAGAVRS